MKSILRGCLSLVLLASAANVVAADCNSCTTDTSCNSNAACCSNVCAAPANCNKYAMTFYRQYPQGQHMGQNSVAVVDKMHQYGRSEFYGLFNVNLVYEQTFRANQVSSYFAGADGLLTIGANKASGSDTTASNIRNTDLGLSSTFSATGCFKPKIQNFIANLDLFLAWDEFICGLYTRLRVPLTWTRYNIGFGATTGNAATGALYPAYFVTDSATASPVVYTTAQGALLGDKAFGDAPVLANGKVCGQNSKFSVSGIQFDMGYNVILNERARVGLAFDVVFPSGYLGCNGSTGCQPCLFSPNIGAQKQWQVGGVLGARYELWNCDEQALLVYFEGMFNAVLAKNQSRLLGLKSNGSAVAVPFNHYLLLKKYNSAGEYQSLERAANLLCQKVKIKTLANVDLMAALEYRNCGFNAWLGYHFAYVGKECGSICTPTFGDAGAYYVIKGDQDVAAAGAGTAGFYNKSDSDISSTGTVETTVNTTTLAAGAFAATDVDATRALAPSLVLNGVFGYLGYDWTECDWAPFLGVGFNADFGRRNFPLSQWGVFLKGGIQF